MAKRRNDAANLKKTYGAVLTAAGFIRTAADSLTANNAVDGQANVLLKELMDLTDLAITTVPGDCLTETTVRKLVKHSHKYVEIAERYLGKDKLGTFDFVFARIVCCAYILNYLGLSSSLPNAWRKVEVAAYEFMELLWDEVENEEEIFQSISDDMLSEVLG